MNWKRLLSLLKRLKRASEGNAKAEVEEKPEQQQLNYGIRVLEQ
jgi:hypothetical protein